jgi:hypothetical protein
MCNVHGVPQIPKSSRSGRIRLRAEREQPVFHRQE